MNKGGFYKFLKILFVTIYVLGTIGIIYVGWQTYDAKNKANAASVDDSLNAINCSNGKKFKLGQYTNIQSKKDINFLDDVELKYVCSTGYDLPSKEKQKIVDIIEGQDTSYFTTMSNLPNIYEATFGDWPLAIPTDIYLANPQLTDRQVEQFMVQLFNKYYKNYDNNISYSLINLPMVVTPAKFDYKDTFLTLLLFLFIIYVLQKITFYIVENRNIHKGLSKLHEDLYIKNKFIVPSLIIGLSIIIAASLTINYINGTNSQESLTVNQNCQKLATKYVNDKETKLNSSIFGVGANNTGPYYYITTLEDYTYNQNLKTCLVYYDVSKSVNTTATTAPSPLPNPYGSEVTDYADDVVSGENLAQVNLDTDCNVNADYCQNLADFNLKLDSLGLSKMNIWEDLFLSTFSRIGFIRSWMGV